MSRRQYYHFLYPERTVPLHCMPVNCGHEEHWADTPYEWDGRRRGDGPFVIWQYSLSGAGELETPAGKTRIEPGHAMLVRVPGDHCYRIAPGAGHWEVLYISLTGSETLRVVSGIIERHGMVIPYAPDSEPVRRTFELVAACRARTVRDRFAASGLAYGFLMSLLAATVPGPDGGEWVDRFREYCLARIDRPISVAELAEEAGMSYFQFCREFRRRTGSSPHQYLQSLKLALAARLLQSSTDSVKQIAGACGFEDPAYFIKVFRRAYGFTPGSARAVERRS